MNTETAATTDVLSLEELKVEPCEHMTEYISAMSDGSLTGPAYWLTRLHVSYCRKCGPALRGFIRLRTHLNELRDEPGDPEPLAPETRAALRQALDALDEGKG